MPEGNTASRPSLGITPRERVGILRAVPWVAELPRDNGHVCQGYVVKNKRNRSGRCRYAARWRYMPVGTKALAESRHYCTLHLFARGLYGQMDDMIRTDTWCNANMEGVLNRLRGR